SRLGPRKPGHSAPVSTAAGVAGLLLAVDEVAGSATGSWPALATGSSLGVSAAAGAGGSAPDRARSRCSGVGVHRQWKSEPMTSEVTPPVRTRVNIAQARRMVATIQARRGPLERRRLATAQATRARLRTGIARTKSNIPIPPPA